MQSTDLQQLKIRKLTKAQYDTITPQTGEIDFVTDAGMPDGSTIALKADLNFEALGTKDQNANSVIFYAWRKTWDNTTIVYTTIPYTAGAEGFKVYDSNLKEIVPYDPTDNYFYEDKMYYEEPSGTSYNGERYSSADIVPPTVIKHWVGSRAQYTALVSKDAGTYYHILEEQTTYLGTIPVDKSITTSITASSTDDEIPSAKAVYSLLGGIENLLSGI